MGVEDGFLRVPYIEGEIWEAHYPQGSKKECQAKWIPPGSQGSLQSPNPRHLIKASLNTPPVFRSNPRYPQRGSLNGDAPRTPKCQKRAMGSRRNSNAREKARLNQPWCRPENVKISLPVRESGQQDFEGLLWGLRIWVPRPISNTQPKDPRWGVRNVRGQMERTQTSKLYGRRQSYPRPATIMGEKNATSPKTVHPRIVREIPGPMG